MKAVQPKSPADYSERPWLHYLSVGLLVFLGCLIMTHSSSVIDTARDVYNAWQIATANGFPLEGPYLGAVIHGGPVWFYVLAIPLIVSSNWVVMSIWVGLLTGLKYALAFACGSRLGSRQFGLIWACLLALPNWTSVNYLIFSHTNLVETMVLLCFYSLIRWQQGSTPWFFVLCLALGVGIHAHPTVYAAGVVALPWVLRSVWQRKLPWCYVLIGALLAAIPLIPYLASQHLHQWPDFGSSRGYFVSQPLWQNLRGFLDVAQGALIDGPAIALGHVLGIQGVWFALASLALAVILIGGLCLALLVSFRDSEPVARYLLVATLISIACVALIRDVTPFYMALVIYPPFYGFIARGWSQGMTRLRLQLRWVFILGAVLSLSSFAVATLQMGREGHLFVPAKSLGDIRTHAVDEFDYAMYYPAWDREKLGELICAQEQPVFFHGIASLILEQSYALEARMRCDHQQINIGGQGPGRHIIGISHHDPSHLNIAAGLAMGSLQLFEISQVIEPHLPLPVPVGDVYPPRPYLSSNEQVFTSQFTARASEILVITNLYHFWMPFSFTVSRNGQAMDPIFQNGINAYFRCDQCAAESIQNWSVTISAPNPEWVELVTFTPTPATP